MKKITVFAVLAITLFSCTKQAKPLGEFATRKSKGNTQKEVTTLGTTATITLTNNGDGTFGIDYGGATDVVWVFFRGGDTLSVSGNVIPEASLSFYQNPVPVITSTFTRINYQAVVVTGSTERDANGIVGTDWVTNYSNVVQ